MTNKKSKIKHLVSVDDFTKTDLKELFTLTDSIRKTPQKYRQALKNKILALLFYEPSTRTRLSFESAIVRLGGSTLSVENAMADSSASKGETISDTMRVVSAYCDGVIMRHPSDDSAQEASLATNKIFINAGSGKAEHPTQALLDVYTIHNDFKKLNGLKIAVAGDLYHGRTCKSLVKLLAQYDGNQFYFVSHKSLRFDEEFKKLLLENKVVFVEYSNLADVVAEADVLYMSRVQKERFADQKLFEKVKKACTLTAALSSAMKPTSIIMHPLPRVDEIEKEVDNNPRAKYFAQAENGLYTRMALLIKLFSK